ncbi:hypothetical protein [Corynebacterium pygosceleis]|uniref:Secreted protein n=1 Tax=Corynebacterium pygosceleis TaxID=2800406 RepID=A0A9Q4C7C0_9CORY|nr:hypothetical protein [Corynebacterium pygosceleis]MCK7637387.1 hypothetical protein [Corynebacterium pygosceleis]MCL0119837.1 hypothetical protein [Corynebacterium pygosceleis]MCX7445291.1 hypothetical protein [Corynebacterium pygosceleis]MCX7468284.1 hypothetical protein [Corynebacterium pygosceleis]
MNIRRFTAASAASLIAVTGLATPAFAADAETEVNNAINKVNSITGLVQFAPCSRVRSEFDSRGGSGYRTTGDLRDRAAGEVAGQIARVERRAGGINAAQRQRLNDAFWAGANAGIAKARSCGIVTEGPASGAATGGNGGGAQAGHGRQPAPAAPAPAPAPAAGNAPTGPAPVLPFPVPEPVRDALRGTVIRVPNPLDPAHPFEIVVPAFLAPLFGLSS